MHTHISKLFADCIASSIRVLRPKKQVHIKERIEFRKNKTRIAIEKVVNRID